MDTGLAGKNVLVTGATSGIGKATAQAFAAEGARVAVTYHVNREAAEEVGDIAVQLDLERPETVETAVAEAVERLGGLDALVVSAVRWPRVTNDRFEQQPRDEWESLLRANLEGAFAIVRAALPALREAEWARIVLISSGIAEEGHPATWGYAAAKAGLVGLARTLAWDAGRDGVLVNVVSTGFTRTDLNESRFGSEIFDQVGELVPQRRASTAEDVARLVLFLGSAANTSVTGEVVREGSSVARTPLVVID
jgi:NAD(P)-dependent dehydrogenase (short-subunit alcohol dehydrogenase family)